MDQLTFDMFSTDLAQRFAREYPGVYLFVAAFPVGSFEGNAGPFTASTLPVAAQPTVLRALADSLERNAAATLIFKVRP